MYVCVCIYIYQYARIFTIIHPYTSQITCVLLFGKPWFSLCLHFTGECTREQAIEGLAQGLTQRSWLTPGPVLPSSTFPQLLAVEVK